MSRKNAKFFASRIKSAGNGGIATQEQDGSKFSVLQKLAGETESFYEFKNVEGMKGTKIKIVRIEMSNVAFKMMPILAPFLPSKEDEAVNVSESGDEASDERAEALRERQKEILSERGNDDISLLTAQERTELEFDSIMAWVRLAIKVIDDGCPDLKGRILATTSELPRTEAGELVPFHFLYTQLGRDFYGLYESIMELSGFGKDRTEKVRTFSN